MRGLIISVVIILGIVVFSFPVYGQSLSAEERNDFEVSVKICEAGFRDFLISFGVLMGSENDLSRFSDTELVQRDTFCKYLQGILVFGM